MIFIMSNVIKIKIDETAPNFIKEYYMNFTNHHEGDAGIDLIAPYDVICKSDRNVYTIDYLIQCEFTNYLQTKQSYYLYPRSSISKTPLMMANSVGIIDAGYRGNIMAKVRNLSDEEYVIKAGDKLFQICSSDLKSIKVQIVTELSETSRGSGGFGSTNKNN